MDLAYDPERVRRLGRATTEAVEHLRSIGSDDPAAQGALDAVRLARRNLADHWMPLLTAVAASRALLDWSAGGPTTPGPPGHHRAGSGRPPVRTSTETDDELVDRFLLTVHLLASHDPDDHPGERTLTDLAVALAARARRSPAVAERLLQLAGQTPSLALLTSLADFPRDIAVAAVAGALVADEPTGAPGSAHHLAAVTAALSAMVSDPGAALDVLRVPGTVAALGTWDGLDQDLVESFVTAALHDAVVRDPQRLGDGYRVVVELVRLAGHDFDDGMRPGLARGVGTSLPAYVETLAPAIRREGDGEVVVLLGADALVIGTYDDVVELFGAVLRDPVAQVSIGVTAGAYTRRLVAGRGAEVVRGTHLARATRFADLLGDATRSEQAELVVAAAAEEAARRDLGSMAGLGLGVGLTAAGVGSVARSVTSRVVSTVTRAVADVEPAQMPGEPIPAAVYDVITTSALALVVHRAELREPLGLAGVDAAQWDELRARMVQIERTDDPIERARLVLALERHVEDVPDLDHYLRQVRTVENLDELTEGRAAGD